jgi:phage terminase large subunit-like protein
MHELRKDIRSLSPVQAEEFMKRLGDDAADDWMFRARDAQLPPPDLSRCWLFLGGRGAGKSHSMSAAVHSGGAHPDLAHSFDRSFHDVNLEGHPSS